MQLLQKTVKGLHAAKLKEGTDLITVPLCHLAKALSQYVACKRSGPTDKSAIVLVPLELPADINLQEFRKLLYFHEHSNVHSLSTASLPETYGMMRPWAHCSMPQNRKSIHKNHR